MTATNAIYSVLRLMNSEWGLSAHAGRQLYLACVTAVSDYGAEIWYHGQKQYLRQLQTLQNKALRKIFRSLQNFTN